MDNTKATTQAEMGQPLVVVDEDANLEAALQVLLDTMAAVEKLENQIKEAKASETNAEQAVTAMMLEQGVDNFRALGKSVTRSEFVRPSVLKSRRQEQIDWLRENGYGAMVEEAVNAQSFGALVRNELLDKQGNPLPDKPLPEFVNLFREQRLLVRSVS